MNNGTFKDAELRAEELVLKFFNNVGLIKGVKTIDEARNLNEHRLKDAKQNAILCWKEIRADRYKSNEFAMTGIDQMYCERVLQNMESIVDTINMCEHIE
jgi:hypothetical protein